MVEQKKLELSFNVNSSKRFSANLFFPCKLSIFVPEMTYQKAYPNP